MSRARSALLVGALAVPLAELGHVVGYGFRVSSSGAHWYFPGALSAAGAVVGAALIAVLAVLVLAKLLCGSAPRRPPWSFAVLFTGLLAAQVAVFVVQEGMESHAIPGTATLAIGLLAQQPVALVAALALRWLSARVGPALDAIASPRRPQIVLLEPTVALAPAVAVIRAGGAEPGLVRGGRAPPI